MAAFFERCTQQLAGKRVFMTGAYHLMYELAVEGLERGVKNVFAKDSAILTGGGLKGFVLPDGYMDVIQEFLGVDRIQEGYGMSEISAFHWACDEKHYHVQPWVIPFLLDPDTSEPLPREGVRTGRAAFYDFLNNSHWGGIISGDEITIDWSTPCRCGLASVHIAHEIMRYSEKQGVEDDRISCSATEEVKSEALRFLRGSRDERVPHSAVSPRRADRGRLGRVRRPLERGRVLGARSAQRYVDRLPLASPMALADLQAVPFAEIADVLAELGPRARLREEPPHPGGLRGRPGGVELPALDPAQQLRRSSLRVPARERVRDRRGTHRHRLPRGLGLPHARATAASCGSARSARARSTCRPATAGSSRR